MIGRKSIKEIVKQDIFFSRTQLKMVRHDVNITAGRNITNLST